MRPWCINNFLLSRRPYRYYLFIYCATYLKHLKFIIFRTRYLLFALNSNRNHDDRYAVILIDFFFPRKGKQYLEDGWSSSFYVFFFFSLIKYALLKITLLSHYVVARMFAGLDILKDFAAEWSRWSFFLKKKPKCFTKIYQAIPLVRI